jgi:hypothetical protein
MSLCVVYFMSRTEEDVESEFARMLEDRWMAAAQL